MVSGEEKKWYVARTRDKQELSLREKLRLLGVEHFIPTRFEMRQLKTRSKEVEIPIIRNLVFVYTTKQAACNLHNEYRLPLFYINDCTTKSMMVIPQKQMDDFMRLHQLSPEILLIDQEHLVPGHRVRVVKGHLAGVEGEIASESGSTYVVIRMKGLLTASVKIAKSYLKKIE